MKRFLSFYFLLFCLNLVQAQNITHAEYFFDADPGVGNGTNITGLTADDTVSFSTTISIASLSNGFHFLAIRVKYNNGVWSHFDKKGFYISAAPISMTNIVAAEYFFDSDPGIGNGTSIAVGPTGAMVNFMATIPQSLPGGFHVLSIRVKDANGRWSLFEKRTFYVSPPPVAMPIINGIEYFRNADPGVGIGSLLAIGTPADTINPILMLPISDTATLGQFFYAFRSRDVNGKWSPFVYDTVTIAISAPPDTTLFASPGLCSRVVNSIDPTVINSEPFSYTLTGATTGSGSGSASGLAFNAGITMVTYTLDNFPTASSLLLVTVIDDQLPSISCPADVSIASDAGICGAVVNYVVSISDNCPDPDIIQLTGLPSGSIFPSGVTTNTFHVTDGSGNSTSCSFTVTVGDAQPPMITCPANITVNLDPGLCTRSNLSLGSPVTSDNCGVASTTNNGLSAYPVGITNVTWTVTDINGLTATCIQTVTVIDNQNPVVTCPANINVNNAPGTCQAVVTFSSPIFSDNCPDLLFEQTTGLPSGSSFPVGETTNTFIATDASGNTTSCAMTITVIDNEFPTVTCPANINLLNTPGVCGRVITYSTPTTENCPGSVLQQTTGLASGSTFPIGTTINTFIITDASGNSSSCSFTITITDNELPTISCPANTTLNTDVGVCGILISYVVSGDDNCPGETITQTTGLPSGSVFPVGVTINTFSITDASGHSATCSFTITVIDNEYPVFNCPENILVNVPNGDQGATVNYTVTAEDNCPGESLLQIAGLPSGSFFPLDTTTNTFVVTDASGNMDTCSFDVIIIDNPILCPNDTIVNAAVGVCSAVVNGIDATTIPPGQDYDFELSGATTGSGSGDVSGTAFNVGVTTVMYTLTDLPQFSCTFTITVLDTQAPEAFCPANITVNNDPGNCSAVVTYSVTTDDNCPGETIQQTNGLVSGSSFPLGLTTNSFLITDASGNTTTCSFAITVIDNQAPAISCPANITINTEAGLCVANVNYTTSFTDNCPGGSMMQTLGLSSGSNFPKGVTTNTFVATDTNGNTSSCSFTINVIDAELPIITCPANITANNDPGICSALINYAAIAFNDNCPGSILSQTTGLASGSVFPVGITTNTFIVTDASGNTASCIFTVTITDNQNPVITCPSNITQNTSPGLCSASVMYTAAATDNCAIASIGYVPASGSSFPVGTTIVMATATDVNGNTSTCTFNVTIDDNQNPTITCPANVTVNTDPDLCTKSNVSLGSPITSDNCGIATSTHNGPSAYPKGNTNVIWTVTDVNGLTASCIQIVTVVDNQNPAIICPGNINVFADPATQMAIVIYDSPVLMDNCPGTSSMQTAGLPSGSSFPLGNTVNTFVATDASGNTSSCSFTVNVRVGKVGVSTTAPLAILHVADSSVLFSGATVLPGTPGAPPMSGAGTRMMWYADKGAFRTGKAVSTEWNKDSIGLLSFAAGESVKSKGNYSIAMGYSNIAAKPYSVAIGKNNSVWAASAIAFGSQNTCIGDASCAFGYNNMAIGLWSTVFGSTNTASGWFSLSTGFNNHSSGTYSAVFGNNNFGNGYASFTIGQFCDTVPVPNNDPLFTIGNGTSNAARKNALMVLGNGNVGLNLSLPAYRLHVSNAKSNDGGYAEGVLVENTHASAGEAAISFKNKGVPVNRPWMVGINQAPPHLAFAYGTSFSAANTHLVIDSLGMVGINGVTPQAPLHIIRNLPSGGSFVSNPLAVFESNHISYLHLSNTTSSETGIISGNQSTLHRSGMIFTADSSIYFTGGGNTIRMKVNKNGNVGISTSSPSARLDVNGTSKTGATGSLLQEIIKTTISLNLPSIANNATHTEIISITNVATGSSVFVSPASTFPDGLIIASARVSSAGNVEVRFVNKSGGAVDPAAMNYYIAVIN